MKATRQRRRPKKKKENCEGNLTQPSRPQGRRTWGPNRFRPGQARTVSASWQLKLLHLQLHLLPLSGFAFGSAQRSRNMDKCANMLPDHTHTLSARVGACVSVCVCVWLVFLRLCFLSHFCFIPFHFVLCVTLSLCSAQHSSARLYAPLFVHVPGQRQTWLNVHAARCGAGGVGEAGGIFYRVRVNWARGGGGVGVVLPLDS